VVEADRIPSGSYALCVFPDGSEPATAEIGAVLVLRNLGDGICEAAHAHGSLSDDENVQIGLKAIELGFKVMRFHVVRGQDVTRHAEFVRTDGVHNFYMIDLAKAKSRLGN